MTTVKIPQYGDPEVLPRGEIRRPSTERMPFTSSGELKPGGPGPLTEERFYEADDLNGLPWTRKRGDEWTTAEFRQSVFAWLIAFFDQRPWAARWAVREVASAVRSGRLPEDMCYLVIDVTSKTGAFVSVSVVFPTSLRTPAEIRRLLDQALPTLDSISGM